MDLRDNIDLRNSIFEGVFSHMYATLTGGVFLTGFALYLGMDELMIGLIAAMPFLVTILQLPTSYLIGKSGKRKRTWFGGAAGARTTWLIILLVILLPRIHPLYRASFILVLIFLSYAFISISHVSWLSLMSDLVPERILGSFFGTRNMLCGAAGMVTMIVFGNLLDFMKDRLHTPESVGFWFTFFSAVLFGFMSLRVITKIPEPPAVRPALQNSFRHDLFVPFRDANFRRFAGYALMWSFSVHTAAPFFTLYFLRDMGFSYGFVALLGMTSALADLIGMRVWGRISDEVRNKAVIQFASWVAAFLPIAWLTVKPTSVVIPILINIIGGGFWAGINLCMVNLLLRISPKENKAMFLSVHNIAAGIGAAAAPVIAGLALRHMGGEPFHVFSWKLLPIQLVFVSSTLMRLLTLQFFRFIREPEEVAVGKLVRVLRNIRVLNIASGFNYLLHPFIELTKDKKNS